MTSPRWGHGGHEVAGEDSNFGGMHAKVAHSLQMEGAVHVRGTCRTSDTAPHRQVPLLSWVRPQYHQVEQFFCLIGPPLIRTTLLPHPLESLALVVRSTLTASSGYGDRSTWCTLTACFTAPSYHSPQGFQAWSWPAHPYGLGL